MTLENKINGPHQNIPSKTFGASPENAKAAMIMVHGRGADAADILGLATEFQRPQFHYVAPEAANNAWYPYSFLAPESQNQPGIDSALQVLKDLLDDLAQNGISAEKTILLGFSQGACLTLRFAAEFPQKFGGIAALSGGLIGAPGQLKSYEGDLKNTPVFLGCSDVDFHIPAERVLESAEIFRGLNADVTERLYSGMGHTINMDEVRFVQQMMDDLLS